MKLTELREGPAIETTLMAAAREVERQFKSVSDVDPEVTLIPGTQRWEIGIRFYSDGEVYRSRPGEEDDDHPNSVESGFKRLHQILEQEVERSRLSPTYTPHVGGSEKGWVYLRIEKAQPRK